MADQVERWWHDRRWRLGIGAAAVLGLAGIAVALISSGDDPPQENVELVAEDPQPADQLAQPTAEPETADDPPLTSTARELTDTPLTATLTDLDDRLPPVSSLQLGPGWTQTAPAPIEPRTAAVAVWTGTEVLIWGGRSDTVLGDGAAYDPNQDVWRLLPEAPLSPRTEAVGLWVGDRLLVLGGFDDNREPLRDGAIFDPVENSWEPIDTGFGGNATTTAAIWTGEVGLLVGVDGPPEARLESDSFVFDPADDSLRAVPASPSSAAFAARVGFATDQGVYVVRSDRDTDQVVVDGFDLGTGTWTTGPPVPGLRALNLDPNAAAWTGTEFVFAIHYKDGATYNPVTGETTPIPGSRSSVRWPAVVVDGHVFYGDIRFDPSTRTWLDDVAYPYPDPEFPVVAGVGDGAFIWGGSTCGRTADCGGFVGSAEGLIWSEPFAGANRMMFPVDCATGNLVDRIDDIEQPSEGFQNHDEAADYWWSQGDGAGRDDRDTFLESQSGRFVAYLDADRNPQIVLRLEAKDRRWRIVATRECRP